MLFNYELLLPFAWLLPLSDSSLLRGPSPNLALNFRYNLRALVTRRWKLCCGETSQERLGSQSRCVWSPEKRGMHQSSVKIHRPVWQTLEVEWDKDMSVFKTPRWHYSNRTESANASLLIQKHSGIVPGVLLFQHLHVDKSPKYHLKEIQVYTFKIRCGPLNRGQWVWSYTGFTYSCVLGLVPMSENCVTLYFIFAANRLLAGSL